LRSCHICRLRNSKWLLLLLGEALRAGAGFHILLMCIASHLLLLRGLPGCLVTERAVPLPLPLKTTNAPISFVGVLFFIFVPNLVQV